MTSITRFITQRLKLKVNEAKSAMARPQERKFLGFSFTFYERSRNQTSDCSEGSDSLAQPLEPPCTDSFARWCGSGRRVTAAPYADHVGQCPVNASPGSRSTHSRRGLIELPEAHFYKTGLGGG